jgi:peptidoglycan/LPS O-acetylase OafA/YrhL
VARAVAVLLVLAAHTVGLWTNQENFEYLPWQAYLGLVIDPLRIDHQAGGHMGLLLFFLVSGYIVSQAADGDSRSGFALKRAARLLPVMVLAVAATLAVAALNEASGVPGPPQLVQEQAYSWHAIAEAVGLGPALGGISVLFVLWTLNVEYQWYLLLWAANGPLTRRPVASTLALMAVVLVLIEVVPGRIGPFLVSVENLTYVFVILIGRWVYIAVRHRVSWALAGWGMLGCLGVYAFTRWPYDGMDVISGPYPRIAAVLWATLILVLLLRFVRGVPWRPVGFVADVSYGIYLFHIPVMWLVLPVISPGGRLFTLGLLVTVTIVLLVSWASYRFIETPIRRAVRRRVDGVPAPRAKVGSAPAASPTSVA